jgi:hypothetical protein
MKHKFDREVLEDILETIRVMEAATYRSQAMALVKQALQIAANAVAVLERSKYSQSSRLQFRGKISGMLRRFASEVLDLGWQSGGGQAGKAPVILRQQYMQKQQAFLSQWHLQIAAEKDVVGGVGRAQQYANSLMELYRLGWERAQTETTGLPGLPAEPRDGTTECRMNCMCRWEIQKKSNVEYWAFWRISPVENCDTCLCRAARWNPLKITRNTGGRWNYTAKSGKCNLFRT